jgi:1,2-phenylacetyl-CoA epoxidase PaaB subunit
LTQELESTKASLTATQDKLTSKSVALDVAVIRKAKIQMTTAEEKLKASKEKLKIQDQSLDSA